MFTIKYILLKHFKRMPLRDSDVFEHTFTSKLNVIIGCNGSGKAQPLSSLIKTPNGWDLMGNMKIGTEVIAKDGTISKVNGVFPQGKKEIFKITFADGRSTRVTSDHLWKVYLSNRYPIKPKILRTIDLINIININKSKSINKTFIWIDLPDSEQNEDKELPIDPYVLGVIIGDGCLSNGIVITHNDKFIMDKINSKLTHGLKTSVRNIKEVNHCLTYSIINTIHSKSNPIIEILRKYGLMGKRSYEKVIPEEYLNSSHNQRLELLQGLMDTDGTIDTGGSISYSTTSFILAKQVQYLVRSLGGIASISIRKPCFTNKYGEKQNGRVAYQVNIRHKKPSELFTLPRKKNRTNDKNQYSYKLKLSVYSIEFDGYEEAQCISIDHPEHLYITDDFIVTHNSSLLNELTPLPSDKNNFNKNGYKEIHIEKDKQFFKLISDFTEGAKYYFYLNDENLNISNNITTQRELVFKYFNITQPIHDLLIGYDNFTDMTLLARKKLFNTITNLNIDVILDNYNKLKEELKNNEYMLKTQLTLYQQEETKLLDETKLKELNTKKQNIKEYIDLLFNIRTELSKYTLDTTLDTIYSQYKDIQSKIEAILNKYYIPITSYPYQSIQDSITYYSNKKEVTQYKLKELYTLLEEKQKQLKLLEIHKLNNIETLKATLTNNINELQLLTKQLKIFKDTSNIDKLENNLYTLEISLPDIVRNIPLNTNRLYTKERYEKLLTDKNALLENINTLIANETSIVNEIKHIEEHKNNKVKCPKCNHEWAPNYNEDTISTLKIKLQNILKDKLNKQKSIEAIDKDISSVIEYFNLYKQYSTIKNNTFSSLKELWEIIDQNEYIFNNPTYILQLIKEANIDIVNLTRIKELNANIATIKETISNLESIKDTNLIQIEKDIHDITEEIYILQESKENIDNILNDINIASKVYTVLNKLYDSLKETKLNVLNSNLSYTINKVIEEIDNELSKNKVTFIELEKDISSYNNVKYTLDKYTKVIDDIKENIKILNIILNELSPKNGLIAKTISNFINVIISGMNNIIESIWDYRMNIKAIDIEEDVLNYKFKVEVENKYTIEDINKVSSGMKEIINLSFRLMMYKLLNLNGYSLYLDEFGVKLDKVHRSNINNLVFKLMNSNLYSQIFLVTHLDIGYSIFKDSEILELS